MQFDAAKPPPYQLLPLVLPTNSAVEPELEALKDAAGILDRIELILCEVSVYAQAYEPSIETFMNFLDKRDFALHDIAALAARRRDNRAHQADFLFVRRNSPLMADTAWS